MSKRRRNELNNKPGTKVVMVDLLSPEMIETTQEIHLGYLEKLGASMPKIFGVPLVQALSYDIIQGLNNAHLVGLSEESKQE